MSMGLSNQVRAMARAKYVHPAILARKRQFSIPVRDLLESLQTDGFPARNAPQVCSALQTTKFLRENGLEIEGVDGPPSKMSTTVVVRYRLANHGAGEKRLKAQAKASHAANVRWSKHNAKRSHILDTPSSAQAIPLEETPEEWAHRLTAQISGLLKEELAEYGGGEAFLRWVRGYDEEDAA